MTPLVTTALAVVTVLHALTAPIAEVPTRPPVAGPAAAAHDPAAVDGAVRGRVTDEASGQPIAAAQVVVVGSANRQGTVTDNDGRYLLRGVAAGRLTLRVLRIGYAARTVEVTVVDGGEVTADVTLGRTLTQLEAVVTTATGLQSRREVGNVIGSIRADTLAALAPVTNVTELLQARTPGVQVIQGNGNTGASPSIRIRGASSLSLSNEPLVIVDGVRIDNSAQPGGLAACRRRASTASARSAPTTSRASTCSRDRRRRRCTARRRPTACSSSPRRRVATAARSGARSARRGASSSPRSSSTTTAPGGATSSTACPPPRADRLPHLRPVARPLRASTR